MLGLAYEIAVVIGCTSLRANSGVRVQRLRMTDRFLAMRVLHVRMSRTIVDSVAPVTHIAVDNHRLSAPLAP